MRISLRKTLAVTVLAAAALWPVATSAQSVESNGQIEQVRAAFTTAGYALDDTLTWDWTRPPVSSFRVHDAAHDRVLMVLVYPSASAAIAGRLQAQAHDEALTGGRIVDTGVGPHLVVGFGPSTWRGNVALVQSSESMLAAAYSAQTGGMGLDALPIAPNAIGVDLDFLQALDSSVANL